MSPKRRAGPLRGRRHDQRLDEAALAVGEGDLGDADVLEGAPRHVAAAARHAHLLLAVHLAHELTHERLSDLQPQIKSIQYHLRVYTLSYDCYNRQITRKE